MSSGLSLRSTDQMAASLAAKDHLSPFPSEKAGALPVLRFTPADLQPQGRRAVQKCYLGHGFGGQRAP